MTTLGLDAILGIAKRLPYFLPEGDLPPAVPLHHVPGKIPLVVVVGPNAGGKSLFRRIVREICKERGVECMDPSMEFRTTGGMAATLFLGSETFQATGQISANTVLSGIKACREREGSHVIFWDEPDIGLSEGYAAGAGQAIARFAQNLPAKTIAAFVASHSRPLIRQLLSVGPHYLHLGEEGPPRSLEQWLAAESPILSLEDLPRVAGARLRRVSRLKPDKRG